jgi:hypothetical protein
MTTQTPATPGQPRGNPVDAVPTPDHTPEGEPARASRLGRSAWWCLAAWPVMFLMFVVIAQQLYPEGAVDPTGPSGSVAFGVVGGVMLLGPPLACLILSAVDFHRARRWRALVPAFVLLALVAIWDVLFAREVANWSDVNWWVFTPTVVVVIAIVSVIAWPKPKGRVGT